MTRKKTSKNKFPHSQYFILIFGLFILLSSIGFKYYRARILSFKGMVSEVQKSSLAKPVRILIEYPKLDLSIEEGAINNGVWSVSETGVVHLNTSANPGDKGNIVIYGHNKRNLFGPIRWIKKGTEVKIINEQGKEFLYEITETKEIKSTEIEYVLPKSEELLTLYTCSGFADSKRFIVTAKPKFVIN